MHTPQRCTNLDGKIDKDHPTPILNKTTIYPLTIHASNFSPSVLSIMYHICCLHAMEQGKATCYDYHTCTGLSQRAMVKCSRSPWLYGVVPSVISPFILLAIASEVCSLLECDVLISLSLSLSFFLSISACGLPRQLSASSSRLFNKLLFTVQRCCVAIYTQVPR